MSRTKPLSLYYSMMYDLRLQRTAECLFLMSLIMKPSMSVHNGLIREENQAKLCEVDQLRPCVGSVTTYCSWFISSLSLAPRRLYRRHSRWSTHIAICQRNIFDPGRATINFQLRMPFERLFVAYSKLQRYLQNLSESRVIIKIWTTDFEREHSLFIWIAPEQV